MKKVVSILLTASMIACSAALPITAIAAETTSVTTTTMPAVDDPIVQTAVVTVTIMDISGDNVLVKPVDDSPELKSSSKFSLSVKQLPAAITPKVGMKLEITYNGGILETYPAMFGNVQKVVEVKDDTIKEDPTLLKGTKDMTLNDVMRLAELGDELDWADFKDYKGRDVGSGLYIWEFTLEDNYVLDVGGTTDKKPLYILLSHADDKGIDIRTDDVKEYIASMTVPVVNENETVTYKIITLPDKTVYKLGESISLKGIQVEVKKGNEEPVIYTYPDVAFDYQSDIPKAPTVTLSGDYKRDKVGTVAIKVIGSDDVLFNVEFVDDSTEKTQVNSVMLTTESGDNGCYIHLDLKSGTFSMSGSTYQNFAVFGRFERKGNDLYLYAENGSTNVYVLHKEDAHFISQSDEKGISLTKGLVFSAENDDAFWEELTSINESTVKGDSNCDSQVDLSDAVMIMQALANPNKYGIDGTAEHHLTEQGKLNGDMDGNGLTVGDAQAIQRKLLGLDDEEKSFSATLLGIDKAKVIGVKVTSLPEGYDYSFTDKNAQAVVDYLSNISLSTNLSVEDPGQLNGMTWVIKLNYENGDTVTLYDLGKFIHGTDRKWYEMTYEESQEFSNLVWKLGKSDNDKNIDNSEYLIGNEPSVSVMKPQRLALNCNSFCANGETLKIQMLMGDKYTYNQEHNSYPNFDSDGNPEYTIFATENYKKINDERLVVNGAKSEYTKAFTKEDMKSLDITGKEGDYTAYYTDTAEIDFSSYPSGSTGCISVSFGWKADGVNPHNTSSDFDGTSQTIYFYVGENGTGISNNGWEAAQKAYEDKSDNDIMFYDSLYVKWNGKEVMSNLYDALRKPSDAVLPINFKLSMSPDYNFEYKGKKLSEYSNANYSEEMMKLKDLQMYGNQLKYGETIYTTGMPDGTKRTKEWYEERVEYFGEELLSKYIVDGEFLEEKLRVDINELMKNNRIANEEAEKAFYSYISDEAIKQLDKQNIKYEYMTEPKRLVIYVTAEEFKAMKLDNVSRYGLDISVAKGVTVNAIA